VYLRDIILLIIRAHWGYAFFLAGLGKFRNFERTAKFFDSLGIPLPELNAYLAAGTEMFGGLFLLLGLGSRLVPLPLIFTMAVAYGTAHTKELSALLSYPDSDAFFEAAPFLFLFAALLVFASDLADSRSTMPSRNTVTANRNTSISRFRKLQAAAHDM
jgi:putative oxidoreductase